jgi:hypothetical protein
MTIGMIVLVAALDPHPGSETAVSQRMYTLAGFGTLAGIGLLLSSARRGRRLWRTSCLGAAAGASFGLTATLIKATTAQMHTHGVLAVFTTWQTYTAIGVGLLGVTVMQAALHSGPLLAAQPGVTLFDPLVSVLWGVLVYDEAVRGHWWLAPALSGAVAIVVGVVLLAHSPLLAASNETKLGAGEPVPASWHPRNSDGTCSAPT